MAWDEALAGDAYGSSQVDVVEGAERLAWRDAASIGSRNPAMDHLEFGGPVTAAGIRVSHRRLAV